MKELSLWNREDLKVFKVIMDAYDNCRLVWIAKFGSDEKFNEFFTKQIEKLEV